MSMSLTEASLFNNLSVFDKLCRKFTLNFLTQLQYGDITIVEANQRQRFGDEHAVLKAVITVVDPQFYQRLAMSGSVGAGEAYINGWWRCDNLTALVRIFALNLSSLDKLDSALTRMGRPLLKLINWRNRNSKQQAKKNIAAHYDLGNDMYRLFLDSSMMYSSAVYPSAEANLAQAQQHKLQLICQRLQLSPSDHLLEIGTGWGSMAIYAAQHYGCKVTTTTISQQQYDYTATRVKELGLEQQITLLLSDYRDLAGNYDKLVSIEMVEAVGDEFLDTYFAQCSSLLKPDGLMLIQAITIVDQRYKQYVQEVDFIKRYVFPGGSLPSITRMTHAVTHHTDMMVRQLHDIGFDYARTVKDWRDNFMLARDQVHQLGFDDHFVRLWHFYLCYCEGGFLERATSVVHLVLSKPANRSA
ncbi:SAM-dependent methyltransferase [Rheinheimera salexigens]|uniref:Cyclopropane-fatty-acyl-phospholipid synthase n=1 Tax=Rheinheimera salexigens TaxID=1628148 RepID=A0A1E7Q6N0_9GAMM|nr:cyclopropane-fatty-acyl-phospholipid synthase family protein [Rheinheimera salexigens]OEY69852.1 cyclopropane-fatty-acyl-phospholipid synthase [Rheinheimera salexigens]